MKNKKTRRQARNNFYKTVVKLNKRRAKVNKKLTAIQPWQQL